MKIAISLIFITFFFVCCCTTKTTISKESNHATKTLTGLPDSLSASNGFRVFWNDLETDSHSFASMDKYIPSPELISKYGLKETNKVYLVSGFIQLNENFDRETFIKLGGVLINYTDKLHSFSIPVKSIPEFVLLKGIKRIELNTVINRIKSHSK